MTDEDIVTIELEEHIALDLLDMLAYLDDEDPCWGERKHIMDIIDHAVYDAPNSQFDRYQKATSPPLDGSIETNALRLSETVGVVSRRVRDDYRVAGSHADVGEELGDVCCSIARLCTAYGYDLDAVIRRNEKKMDGEVGAIDVEK